MESYGPRRQRCARIETVSVAGFPVDPCVKIISDKKALFSGKKVADFESPMLGLPGAQRGERERVGIVVISSRTL